MSRHFSGFELESPEPRGRQMVSGTRIGRALHFFSLWAWPMYPSPCWARSLRHICLALGPLVSRVQCGRPARTLLGPGLLRSMPIFIAITYYKPKERAMICPLPLPARTFEGLHDAMMHGVRVHLSRVGHRKEAGPRDLKLYS